MSEEIENGDEEQMLGYAASSNISFHGKLETGYTRTEWAELPSDQKDAIIEECLWELVDIWEED